MQPPTKKRKYFIQGETLINKVLDIVKPELKAKNIQIQLRVEDGLVIKVNPAEIEQAILNLANNAVQALANSTALERRITIEVNKTDKLVQFSVSDNDTGVFPLNSNRSSLSC